MKFSSVSTIDTRVPRGRGKVEQFPVSDPNRSPHIRLFSMYIGINGNYSDACSDVLHTDTMTQHVLQPQVGLYKDFCVLSL